MRSLLFWLQDVTEAEQRAADDAGEHHGGSQGWSHGLRMVESVRFPGLHQLEAPLPEDQRNILIPRTATDAFLQIEHAAGLAEAVEMLG